jgi:hypothetical protein
MPSDMSDRISRLLRGSPVSGFPIGCRSAAMLKYLKPSLNNYRSKSQFPKPYLFTLCLLCILIRAERFLCRHTADLDTLLAQCGHRPAFSRLYLPYEPEHAFLRGLSHYNFSDFTMAYNCKRAASRFRPPPFSCS